MSLIKNKYGNKKSMCLLKHTHDSKGEANYCNRLLAMKQNGEIVDFLTQVIFLLPGGIRHIVDFYVKVKEYNFSEAQVCGFEVHEFKGFKTDVWRIKKKLFEESYPHIPYKVICKPERRKRCKKQLPQKIRRVITYR